MRTTNGQTEQTYRITRFFQRRGPQRRGLPTNLTLAEAQAHCQDLNTSSATAWMTTPLKRTQRCGPWFDGYEREGGTV